MALDIETLKQVDITSPDNTNAVVDSGSISGGGSASYTLINNVWPDDVVYVEYDVACIDENANGFRILLVNNNSNAVWVRHTGDVDSSTLQRAELSGSFHILGRDIGSGDGSPEWDNIDFEIENDGNSTFSFDLSVRSFLLHRDFMSRKRSGLNLNDDPDFNFYGSVESFD